MPERELPERTASQQNARLPYRPESDVHRFQPRHIQRVNALGRRQRMHAAKMLLKQGTDIHAGGIIDFNLHDRSF